MDRFLKTNQSNHPINNLGRAVCIFGRGGIGKTYFFKNEFKDYIEITSDILKNKNDTIEFLNKIKGSRLPVLLDDYECISELIGVKEIKTPPTNGIFIVISQVKINFDFEIVIYNFPIKSTDEIKKIYPNATIKQIESSNGNLRILKTNLSFNSDYRDDIQGPHEFIKLITSRNSSVNPCNFIGHPIQEPGNVSAILHENYTNAKWKNLEDLAECSDYLSQSTVIDGIIYDGNWDLLQYYNLWGCILPAMKINHTLTDKNRPGSIWTKYQNTCMRAKKIADIGTGHLKIDVILLLRDYAEAGNIEILKEYQLKPSDLDVLNHLSPLRKINPKVLASLKKSLISK